MTNSNDFLDKISQISNTKETEKKKPSRKGRKVEVEVLEFEIDEEKDTELAVFVKQIVNKAQITNQDVYNALGRVEGWNLINGLRKGSVSWGRVKKWCEIIGYRVEITLSKID
ncbi:hypothetical protein INTERNEXUS_44 [Bacillus phage vB_BspM_Internexus]|nr:hypothetical protein INTERNEXUS_44 [Bacillus phage vB_BspM_Internexus]